MKKKRRVDQTADSCGGEEDQTPEPVTEKRKQNQTEGPKRKQMKLDIFLVRGEEIRRPEQVQLGGEEQKVPIIEEHRRETRR